MLAHVIEIDLSGKAALVTGAGAGIGREIALWLARAGAAVAVNDIDPDRARRTADEIGDEAGKAVIAPANVRDPQQVSAMVDRVVTELGRIDIAVNNVGNTAGVVARPFLEMTVDDAFTIIDQNLRATYACCLAEAKALVAQDQGGLIVNVSSGETTRPSIGLAPYGASKAGINHLVKTMAAELGPYGIRVNAIAPGTTFTEDVERHVGREQIEAIWASTPLRRPCEHDELARLTVFLASDLARNITGQLMLADAGAHLGRKPLQLPQT
jgi:NAD(P)-dependent dehydrogenase (short-subunit alcohol dehydrogenase family)